MNLIRLGGEGYPHPPCLLTQGLCDVHRANNGQPQWWIERLHEHIPIGAAHSTAAIATQHLHRCLPSRLLPMLSNIIVTRPMTAAEKAACNLVTTDIMFDTRAMLNYFRRLPDDRLMLGNRGAER